MLKKETRPMGRFRGWFLGLKKRNMGGVRQLIWCIRWAIWAIHQSNKEFL